MRPQFNWRARRATAALGAVMVTVGVFGTVASAKVSRPQPARQHRPVRPRRPVTHHPVRHRRRLPALWATMLHRNVLVGQDVAFIGALVRPDRVRHEIGLQERLGNHWVQVARASTDRHGRFLARFWPHQLGQLRLRVQLARSRAEPATVTGPVATVFQSVVASWYGPGGTTACGEALGAATLGVANRTLPCGTLVTLRYGSRSVRVPVIDRGPYVAGRTYDLTYATKQALGAGDVSVIWASA